MNNQQSAFQQTYPLSSRKFLKKVLPTSIWFGIFSIVVGFFVSIILIASKADVTLTFVSFIVVCVGLFFILLVPYAWYISVYIKMYFYNGSDDFVTIKKGVFAPQKFMCSIKKFRMCM